MEIPFWHERQKKQFEIANYNPQLKVVISHVKDRSNVWIQCFAKHYLPFTKAKKSIAWTGFADLLCLKLIMNVREGISLQQSLIGVSIYFFQACTKCFLLERDKIFPGWQTSALIELCSMLGSFLG